MKMRTAPARPTRGLVRLVIAAIVIGIAQLVLSQFLAGVVAAGHAMFHALFALGVLLPALGIAWRWPGGGLATRAPVLGLIALAAAQLVESLGAFGYGPDNDRRINGMVLFHDLGLALTAFGMILALIGIVAGIALAAKRRQGPARIATISGAAAVGVTGVLLIKTMIGF